jgi:hypothetical protein
MLTETDFSVLRPAASTHFRVKVVACVTAVLESVPESAFAPLHTTLGEEVAVQDVAPWLVHVRPTIEPEVTVVGVAVSVTVGAAGEVTIVMPYVEAWTVAFGVAISVIE